MSRRSVALWSVGIGLLAAVAMAASQAGPVEATAPAEAVVPAAERVETVLRATYVLPADRGADLAKFLIAHAAPGIDVRPSPAGDDATTVSLTVIAPEAEQQALGAFIEKCVNKEPSADRRKGGSSPFFEPTPEPDPAFGRATPDFDDAPSDKDSFARPPSINAVPTY